MFPSAPPQKHNVQFALKLSVQFTPPAPPACPPEIAKSDLPSNRQVRFTLKSSVRIYLPPLPAPRNRQVWFTFKSPSPIYPQIICTIYPPSEIAKSDLPSNRLYDLPPPKSPSPIYPQIICTIYPPPPKLPSLIYPQIANCRGGKLPKMIWG